jgi:hypothetical protein
VQCTATRPGGADSAALLKSNRSRPRPPIRMSRPSPPFSVSLPMPPSSRSLPLVPDSASLPARPKSRSEPPPPRNWLGLVLPAMWSLPSRRRHSRPASGCRRRRAARWRCSRAQNGPRRDWRSAPGSSWSGARLQIELQVRRVVAEVVSIDATAVPHGHQDVVVDRRGLSAAVDEHLPGCRAPRIDRVPGVVGEVGAIKILQRRESSCIHVVGWCGDGVRIGSPMY